MPIIKWSPLVDPWDGMDRMMRQMSRVPEQSFIPAVDVYETKDAVVIETPLAGMDVNDVSVNVEGNTLIISGESNKEREVDEKNYYRKEVRTGSFHRALRLPKEVDAEKIKAEFEQGVLKITAPKTESKEAKKINIDIKKNK